MSDWTVPSMWRRRTVAVLASGSSMSAAVAEIVRSAGVPAIAVNNTFRLAPWADILYAADADWWRCNPDAADFAGIKVSVSAVPGVNRLRNSGPEGFDANPRNLRTGGNSAYQAVHLAMHTGARRILLCGVDMGGPHWHEPHGKPLRATSAVDFARWIARFEKLSAPARQIGTEIVNCSDNSALKCFRFDRLESALQDEG